MPDPADLVPPGFSKDHPGVVPTACIHIVEGIDEDGDLSLFEIIDEGTPAWKVIGMLEWLLAELKALPAAYAAAYLEDDED